MRIVFVVTRSDAVGGAQVHIRDMSTALRDAGHHPIILCGGTGPWLALLREREIPVIRLRHMKRSISPFRDVRALFELRSQLRKLAPDIVSTHTAKAGWLGRLAAYTLGLPVIFTAHGWTFTDGVAHNASRVWRMLERIAGPWADSIVTVSEFDRRLAVNAKVAHAARITAIHNGMPDIATELMAAPGGEPPHIVMVARFEAQKDHGTLLRALSSLKRVPWRLSLVGDGPLRSAMKILCEQLGLGERVRFLGARSDVARILSNAQLFVLCTHWEGLPRSIIEAMRAGLPAIATRVAGVPELIEHGVSGWLCDAADHEDVSRKLESMLASPARRIEMGGAARRRYVDLFRFEHMYDKTVGAYADVIARRERAAVRVPSATKTAGLTE